MQTNYWGIVIQAQMPTREQREKITFWFHHTSVKLKYACAKLQQGSVGGGGEKYK